MTNQMSIIVIFLFSFFNSSYISAQSATAATDFSDFSVMGGGTESANTIFKTMSQDGILKVTLETDMDHLMANKKRDDYQKAKLTWGTNDTAQYYDVKVKPRGKFRRKTCEFPPLKIKFNKAGLADKGISTDHKSLKLVTHCMYDDGAEQRILKEYLAYKMYNVLTESSFKVQLVEVTYVNSAKDTLDEVKYGFIIENTNELAERIEGVEVENYYNLTLDSIQKTYSHLIPMFQYMISNLDYRPAMLQNVKVIDKTVGHRIMVPYDFDFSGLVDAPYAKPSKDHNQIDVRQRIYTNKVEDLSELMPTIRFFQIHEEKMMKVIEDCDLLTKKNKREVTKYIKNFYKVLDDPATAEGAFVKF